MIYDSHNSILFFLSFQYCNGVAASATANAPCWHGSEPVWGRPIFSQTFSFSWGLSWWHFSWFSKCFYWQRSWEYAWCFSHWFSYWFYWGLFYCFAAAGRGELPLTAVCACVFHVYFLWIGVGYSELTSHALLFCCAWSFALFLSLCISDRCDLYCSWWIFGRWWRRSRTPLRFIAEVIWFIWEFSLL